MYHVYGRLEIDMADFKKNSVRGLTFGLYTFLIPMLMGTAAGVYLLDFSYPTSILLASMFASHTLITYPIVSKYGVTKNRAVNVTIGATIVTCILHCWYWLLSSECPTEFFLMNSGFG